MSSRKFSNHIQIAKLAFPIILANAAAPLLGLADTAAIGQTGIAEQLGAIALGSLIFNFVYWGFGFLRMGTTGFISQAMGAGDVQHAKDVLLHALVMGTVIGLLLLVFSAPIALVSMKLMGASDEVKLLVKDYFYIRIWGAPAALCTYALSGALIGLGKTRAILVIQIFLNAINILLNLFFVLVLNWGVKGIAAGTLIAEVLTFGIAFYYSMKAMDIKHITGRLGKLKQRLQKGTFLSMIRVNSDIMIRTLALLAGFAWFTNKGAVFGDVILAANHILLQFISLSAFFLDGYANVVEMFTGKAIGAKNPELLNRQIRDSTQLAGVTALALAALILFVGDDAIAFLTKNPEVKIVATNYLPFAAVYVALSFCAFQLDGIFIGAIKSKEMRNATVLSLVSFLLVAFWLTAAYGNRGLWVSFVFYVVVRAVFLGLYFKRIGRMLN